MSDENLGGRPRIELDSKQYEILVGMMRIQCTQEEICEVLGMSPDTLDRRLKERGDGGFAELYKRHQGEGRASLRRMQWKAAEGGNPTMLIWLGKQVLGQREKSEVDNISSDGSMTPPDRIEIVAGDNSKD